MRISDWSSDVCSSDLVEHRRTTQCGRLQLGRFFGLHAEIRFHVGIGLFVGFRAIGDTAIKNVVGRRLPTLLGAFSAIELDPFLHHLRGSKGKGDADTEIGRASCRERMWQYGYIWVGAE